MKKQNKKKKEEEEKKEEKKEEPDWSKWEVWYPYVQKIVNGPMH
jgi:hypothetical protein